MVSRIVSSEQEVIVFTRISLIALVLALALSAAISPAAAKAQTIHFSTRGMTGSASFYDLDETGCIETFADVYAVDGRVKQTGKPAVFSEMFVFLYQYDYCSGLSLLEGFGYTPLAAGDFVINKKVDAAALHTSLSVYDYISGTDLPATVDLIWTGTGGVYQQKYHAQYRTPGFRYNYRSMGTFRQAEASGSLQAAGIEFALSPSGYAELANVKSGEVDIAK